MSYYQPRQYIFDGKSILLNQYDEVNRDRYDQTFEAGVVQNEEPVRESGYDQFNQSNNLAQSNTMGQSTNLQQTNQAATQKEFTENKKTDYKLVPEELIEELKNNYYQQMGYIQNDPEKLYKYFLEFRVKEKKGLRINRRLQPLMKYTNDDVYYSIKHYYQMFLDTIKNGSTMAGSTSKMFLKTMKPQSQNKTMQKTKTNQISDDIMRRLYPRQKKIEENEKNKMNCYDFGGFFIKLLDN